MMFRRKDYNIGTKREEHIQALRRSFRKESVTGLLDMQAEAAGRIADWHLIADLVEQELAVRHAFESARQAGLSQGNLP